VALERKLVAEFEATPEAKGLREAEFCPLVMDLAAQYSGETIATLHPDDLRATLFEIIPRKVSMPASAARRILAECRAFYTFLKRACGFELADACLRVVSGKADERLEAQMADAGDFGMAKSIFMAGRDAGFDLDSREGIEAWMSSLQGQPLPASVRLPSAAPKRSKPPRTSGRPRRK
jgi:hypothetical protein